MSSSTRQTAFADICSSLRLLKNLLYHSEDAKSAAASTSLLRVLRGLVALVTEHPDSRCTTQLLHVCAATIAHSPVAQTWWDERLGATEHNGDARFVLNFAIRIAKKQQVSLLTCMHARQGK